jgi:hypothetical protein
MLPALLMAAMLTVPLAPAPARDPGPVTPQQVAAIAHAHARVTVAVVHSGDTLSSVAARYYGAASLWPALWWVNRAHVPNPNMIMVGQRLRLSHWHPSRPWLTRAAMRAAAPAPVAVAAPSASVAAPVASASYSGASGSYQACVIARESGGDAQVMNASGHYGLYQFSSQTWAANGGNPADFGNASVAEQNQVFANTMATGGGAANWSPYDGC